MNRLLTIVDSKYQRLEYLESTGTQYIDTGYKAKSTTRIVVKCFLSSSAFQDSGGHQLVGSDNGLTTQFGIGTAGATQKNRFQYGQQVVQDNIGTMSANTPTIFEQNGNKCYVDGSLVKTFSSDSFSCSQNTLLFTRQANLGSGMWKGGVNYCQIYDNDVLVRNFVPVLRKTDNELGMLDLVEGKFYPNAGTGKFTANLDTMYAIIQGSPTQSPYGVFSGFSASNYLRIQSLNVSITNWELVLNIKSNATTSFLATKNSDILIRQYSATRIAIFMSSQGNATYDIANALLVPLTISTNAWLKISFTGSSYVFSVSYDGINYEVKQTISSSSQIQNLFNSNYINLGYSSYIGSAYNGVINLNRSSITIGSTKYNLQAVVGYTVVGSPTITDGVASGFTTSDYVRTSQDWDTFADAETWKIHTRIITGESYSTTRATGIISGQGFQTGFGISNNGYLQAIIYLSDNSSFSLTTSFIIESNTSYDIELEKTQSQYIFRVKKTNTVTWEEKTNNSTLLVRNNAYNPNYLYFGNVNYFSVVFTGSIDMNETIIFVNNKLYFNGQQA